MIKVHRLNGTEMWINAELIEMVEGTPDTVISLTNRDKIVVQDKPEVVVQAILEYRRQIHLPPLLQRREDN